ncbi:MAG: ATP-binding protein [Acidobacteriota bacterium]
MIERRLHATIRTSLRRFPAVAIVGSRQTGKTTLARAIASEVPGHVYLDLERPADVAKLDDPELFLRSHRSDLVIIDEVHRRPDLFPILRVLIDERRRNGRFLVLGSASPALLRQSAESLAGRIAYHELPPFRLDEVEQGERSAHRLWLRGGYPRSYLARTTAESLQWRDAFIGTYLERDLPQFGVRVPAGQLRRFWQMLAHTHGRTWNASEIARSLGVSAPTASHYLAILEDTFVVRRLQPYHANLGKRLVKCPKVYLRDTGLLHALLGLTNLDQLSGHPSLGASWEGFVVEQIVALLPDTARSFFFRTATGVEVDLIVASPGRPPIPIEIKAGSAPALSRGFRVAFDDLGCSRGYVIHRGDTTYPLAKGIEAVAATDIVQVFGSGRFLRG